MDIVHVLVLVTTYTEVQVLFPSILITKKSPRWANVRVSNCPVSNCPKNVGEQLSAYRYSDIQQQHNSNPFFFRSEILAKKQEVAHSNAHSMLMFSLQTWRNVLSITL